MGGVPLASHISRRRRRRRMWLGERGQSLVEFSVMLPIVLIMLLSVVEVVNLYDHYISVVNASRDGARIGSKGSATDAEIRSLVGNDMARLPNGINTTNDVTINRTPVPGDNAISVKTCYDHHLLLGIPFVLPSPMRVCSTTTMRMIPTPGP
ncbi:MAG: TadE/TadG family type IV pilus assembly protein [Gemmatimonadaceae bacterium]